ncbi:hypothetical protein [Clostridium sp.]|uniref:hypothetical protein n=1 Tax=Clostridium sp. TaxID=1506 RepID=UPI00284115A7|nr:hypothetical protein [Clostridium sp.]MDR3593233.1 hypothetical protein [Clostridium sp.]
MPVHKGIEKGQPYFQWGEHGKKYFYIAGNKPTLDYAKAKAKLQGRAIKRREKLLHNKDVNLVKSYLIKSGFKII